MINARYGELLFSPVGNINVTGAGGVKELTMYAARVASKNLIPYNLIIAAVPRQYAQGSNVVPLRSLQWVTLYLRSYFEPKLLAATMDLDWAPVLKSEPQESKLVELPAGLWLSELRDKTVSGEKNKYYTFANPAYAGRYVVTVESRASNASVAYGTGLRDSYEFDLLLNHDMYNVAVEKLVV